MAEQNPTLQPTILTVPTTVKSLIEALVFGAREPLSVRQIQTLYEVQGTEGGEPRKIDYETIARFVEELNGEYSAADRPYRIVQIAGGYQFATLPMYAEWLGKLYKEQTRRKLSQSSVETLAIIAYKQPITKPEIESIRGVNCDYVLSTLLEKDLATIVGRATTVGRPLLYGTSGEFLKHFGLNDLNDLPRPREIQEILGDNQFETERRMLEAQQGLAEEKKEEEFKSRLPHIPKRKPGMDEDVKIVPKKRLREINVRHAEESEKQAEEAKSEVEVPQTSDIVDASVPSEPGTLEIPADSDETSIPTSEKGAEVGQVLEAELQDQEPDAVQLAESLKYIDLTKKVADDREIQEELQPLTPEMAKEKLADSEVADKEVPVVEESVELAEELTTDIGKAGQSSEEQSLVTAEGPDEVIPAEASSAVLPEVEPPLPVEVAGSESVDHIEEQELPAPGVATQGVDEDHQSPQSKSRWTTWKEKIQGFIKKLFG
jgi:segregation and condensation protein B